MLELRARNQLVNKNRADDVQVAFKRHMGSEVKLSFPGSGLVKSPQELSAEILKTLRSFVQRDEKEEVTSAVITVPAAFLAPATKATNEAARLAGIEFSPLIQEPVAAAMAYGYKEGEDDSRWLVFDFGGGTFDAAIIQSEDGILQVKAHEGDNYLGGTDVDIALMEQILIPAVNKEFNILTLGKREKALLQRAAEIVKIQLSQSDTAIASVEEFYDEEDFEMEVTRADLGRIVEPFVEKTMNLTNKLLKSSKLNSGDFDRVILVGGSTKIPMVQDAVGGLGIEVDTSVDPFTVVAEGAAIYAATQTKPISQIKAQVGEYRIKLDYNAVGPDDDPDIAGNIMADQGENFGGWTLELARSSPAGWTSGQHALREDGVFSTNLIASEGATNDFQVILRDPTGTQKPVVPASFSYTIGAGTPEHQPLTNDVGLALHNNSILNLFKEKDPLPTRKRVVCATAAAVRRGDPGSALSLPLVEGKHLRADRNTVIGRLNLPSNSLRRDLPMGSEVEVSVRVDESREYHCQLFIPILDQEFHDGAGGGLEKLVGTVVTPSSSEVRDKARNAQARYNGLKEKARSGSDPDTQEALNRLEREDVSDRLERIIVVEDDGDLAKGDLEVREAEAVMDDIEGLLEWPEMERKAREEINETSKVVNQLGTPSDRDTLADRTAMVQEALMQRDPRLLEQRLNELNSLKISLQQRDPAFWVGILQFLKEHRTQMSSPGDAQRAFDLADRAVQNGDVSALQAACRELIGLLPMEVAGAAQGGLFQGNQVGLQV